MTIIHRIFSILFALSCVSTSALSVPLTDFAIESVDTTRLPVTVHPPLETPAQLATAIILNTNARSVTNDLEALAKSIFGNDHVFVTSNEEEARHAAAATLQYKLVIPVGGDGTLSSLVNYMCDELLLIVPSSEEHQDNPDLEQVMQQLPLMGYIPMGTGNGVGSVVGCRLPRKGLLRSRRRRLRQLKQIMEQLQKVGQDLLDDTVPAKINMTIIPMPMIEVQTYHKDNNETSSSSHQKITQKGALCFFAGVGFDSLMLNDFKALKAWSQRTGILKRALGSVTGYCVALITMTLPQCVLQNKHKIHVKLTTRCKEETLWIDHRRGDFAQRIDTDDINDNGDDNETGVTLLYEGAAGILAVGTSPFYGGGLRLFPFARIHPDKMHLRLGRIHPLKGFLNIPRIFEGSYRDDDFGCLDFLGNDFDVEVRQDNDSQQQGGYPFQHSGESAGFVERFRLRLVKEPVRFVSFLPKRVIVPDKNK